MAVSTLPVYRVVFTFAANVYGERASIPLRPLVELHAFAVVYVRFTNVYYIHTVVWRPGAFETRQPAF